MARSLLAVVRLLHPRIMRALDPPALIHPTPLFPLVLTSWFVLCCAACDRPAESVGTVLNAAAPPESGCSSDEVRADRRALLDALGEGPVRVPAGSARFGINREGTGWTSRAVAFAHPSVPGDEVIGTLFMPDPLPPGPPPFAIGLPGHFGEGIESDEVLRPAQLLAVEGWMVLLVAARGRETGADPSPGWRELHEDQGLYAELRVRRGGTTPLAWDVAAARRGLDLAATTAFGVVPDSARVAVFGHSGGAERAAVLAATDPRVGYAVIGAFEYAFETQDGFAGCSCGALHGSTTVRDGIEARHRWLALSACRPGDPSGPRPALLWAAAEGPADARARALSPMAEVRTAEGHGFSHQEVVDSVRWLESTARGRAWTDNERSRIAADLDQNYLGGSPDARIALAPSAPGPGRFEQGPPPWRVDLSPPAGVMRAALGIDDLEPQESKAPEVEMARRPSTPPRALLVVSAPGPSGGRTDFVDPFLTGAERAAWLGRLADDNHVAMLELAVARTWEDDQRESRAAVVSGDLPLARAVAQVIAASEHLRRTTAVAATEITWVGLGAAGVPVLLAANLVGETGPVRLIGAPVTLWFDGPGPDWADGSRGPARWGVGHPFQPWPTWVLGSVGVGGSLDPWLSAKNLAGRLRWFDPRGGDGSTFGAHLPWGVVVKDVDALFAP